MGQVEQRLIARYGTLSLLGSGGMGTVYRVHDGSRGCDVAIKTVVVPDAGLRARLHREAGLLARLTHPNICPILEWHEEGDAAWIVMPALAGVTLDRCSSALDPDAIVDLLLQACRGVAVAHAAGLVHRDLKPANLMVVDPGGAGQRAVVMDFGIAHARGLSTLTGTHEVLGTPAYMAPEQARAEMSQMDARTDVWGLGATLYDALTGQPPFGHGSLAEVLARVLDDDVVSPCRLNPSLPEPLARICLKALERDPARRYPSAMALAEDLQRYRDGRRVVAPTPGPLFLLRRMLARHPRFWGALAVLTLALLMASAAAIHIAWQARTRVLAAEERSALVERVRAGMRAARLAPLHSIENERALFRRAIDSLRAGQGEASSEDHRANDRALAQALYELGDWQAAQEHSPALLQDSPGPGERELYARIELGVYSQAWAALAELPSGSREAALDELRSRHVQPALAALATLSEVPPLLRAELALAEMRFEDASAALAEHRSDDAGDARPAFVAGDLERARAERARERGERAEALRLLDAASSHYAAALSIVRSDPQALTKACEVAGRRQALLAAEGRVVAATAELADPACAALHVADPDSPRTALALAGVGLALAAAHQHANQPGRALELLKPALAAAERAVLARSETEAPLLLAGALQREAALLPDDYFGRKARLDRAVEVLSSARDGAPGSLSLRVALGEVLRDRGRLVQNHRQLQADPEASELLDDYRAARAVLEDALTVRADSLPARRALALTLMFHFYALRDEDPEQARLIAQTAIAALAPALAAQPDHPDLLFDQAANLGDLWTFESGYAEPGARRATLDTLELVWPLLARLRQAAPARADGYDYEIAFRAQAGERLREAGEERLDQLAPVPELVAQATERGVLLTEPFVGWALTERALALADEGGPTEDVAGAFLAALHPLEQGLVDPHRRYDSMRMLLQWSGAFAEYLPEQDPRRAGILERGESYFQELAASERGRSDNIVWCEGGRLAWESLRLKDAEKARTEALGRFHRCQALGPMWFRAWTAYAERLRSTAG